MGKGLWHVATGTTICPECGNDPVSSEQPSRWKRFMYWLRLGMKLGPTLECETGHEWQAGSYTRLVVRPRSRLNRALRLPMTVARTIRHGRRMEPVPLTYLVATGAGLALGAAGDRLWGWSWWLVAVVFVATVWLLFLSTAFWGPHRLRRHDLIRAVAPHRARQSALNMLVNAVAAGEVPVYGLADWSGRAVFGGWGGDDMHPHSVTLRFTDSEDRWVEIVTTSGRDPSVPSALLKENLAENLLGAIRQPPSGDDAEDRGERFERGRIEIEGRLANVEWTAGSLKVNRERLSADVLLLDDASAAFVELDGLALAVTARGVDLATIAAVQVDSIVRFIRATEDNQPR